MTVFNFVRDCLIVCAVVAVFRAPGCNAFTQELCEKACSLSDWLCWFCDDPDDLVIEPETGTFTIHITCMTLALTFS